MTNTDGGPAFPSDPAAYMMRQDGSVEQVGQPGMSLRDWFAGQALPSAIAHMEFQNPVELQDVAGGIARACYILADAMISERNKKP